MKFPTELSNTVRFVVVGLLAFLHTCEKQTALFQQDREMEKMPFFKALSWSHMPGSGSVPRI